MSWWQAVVGRPLKVRESEHEAITAPEGLAALSLDALSSVAYGPQAIMVVLLAAPLAPVSLLLPITLSIVGLLAILVASYSQVIDAYPQGGGAYTVARANLGTRLSLLAGASLVVDYVLTVAVSIAAGVAALTSAFPSLYPLTVPLCLAILGLIVVLNLRGVGESARAFLLPTYVFIGGLLAAIAIGLVRSHPAVPIPHQAVPATLEGVGVLVILKAFSSGCSALTGVEAIANGVPLFREPRQVRARRTELFLGIILGLMLLGLAILATRYHAVPGPTDTLLSVLTRGAVGSGWPYYVISFSVMAVLGLAANTSYGGLPLLMSVLARDDFLPHIFAIRGDRLVYQYGIWVLSGLSAVLLVASDGNTMNLIPLFAVGVFTGFTLSQTGMVVHWRRERPPHWQLRAALNGLGAVVTGTATLVFVVTKFLEGAYVVVVAIPLLIWLFWRVYRYYSRVGEEIHVNEALPPIVPGSAPLVIVPFASLSRLTSEAFREALAISPHVIALTVALEPGAEETERQLAAEWERWGGPVRLMVLKTQYQSVVRPVLRFVTTVARQSDARIMVLIPEIVPEHTGASLLHNQLGLMLAAALRQRTDVIVSILPFHPHLLDGASREDPRPSPHP